MPLLLLAGLLLVMYSNSLTADWQMDDQPNIVNNKGLHLKNLMPESIRQVFYANQGKAPKLYRPLSCLTFALNWYAGGNDPFGYHLVNLGFHVATAWALYLLISQLLIVSVQREKHRADWIHHAALISSILWAVNPIQTQAVTYIIQRMAVMAAFFSVLSIFFYARARTAASAKKKILYATGCFFWFLCGLASKENVVLLPLSLLLVEWIFFNRGNLVFLRRPEIILTALIISVSLILILKLTYGLPFKYILNGYAARPFIIEERLLTQPRVVLEYLSLIFYPLPDRLSIAHDITLSTSMLTPWTTLPAIMIIFAMTIGALVVSKRWPLISFAVLFYFFNHVVESSVLPLELVFEHRNYLPSMFLFLPLVVGLQKLFMKADISRLSKIVSASALIILIMALGLGTYTRNMAWATKESLWKDAAVKAPGTARPMVTLGIQLAWKENPTPADYRHALALFQRSLELTPARTLEQAEILGNIASVYFLMEDYERAIHYYHLSLEIDPGFLKNKYQLTKPLILLGLFTEAAQHAGDLVEKQPENSKYLNMMGFILLWQDRPEEALPFFQDALKKGGPSGSLLMNLGVALTRVGSYGNGKWFLKLAHNINPGDPFPILALIENRIRACDRDLSKTVVYLITHYPRPLINRIISNGIDYRNAPIEIDILAPLIREAQQNAL